MKKKKLRNIILIIIVSLLAMFLGFGLFMKTTLLGIYDIDKAYIQEPPGADITVLYFGQYGCEFCREINPDLQEALAQDGKVRFAPIPVKSFDEFENVIVTAVYAAALQDKFIEMHNAIYKNWPVESLEDLLLIAAQLGLDTTKLQADMESSEVKQKIHEIENYIRAWRLPVVPAFLIDKKILYTPDGEEPVTVEVWKEKFEKVRE